MRITADLGELIRNLREARGIARNELAEQMGVSIFHLEKMKQASGAREWEPLQKLCLYWSKHQLVWHRKYNAGKMYHCSIGYFFRLYRRRSKVSGAYGGM